MRPLGFIVALGIVACGCPLTASRVLDSNLRRVTRGGVDGGGGDGGTDAGRWVIDRVEIQVDAGLGQSWIVTALGPTGAMAGRVSYPGHLDVWLSDPQGELVYQGDSLGQIAQISGLASDGRICGVHYEPSGGVAELGYLDSGFTDYFDGGSVCGGLSPGGAAIVLANNLTYVLHVDGGISAIDMFQTPDASVNLTYGYAINDAETVVGSIADGKIFGYGNPTPFVWTASGGRLLDNSQRDAEAFSISSTGVVAGIASDSSGVQRAAIWEPPAYVTGLLPLPSGYVSAAAQGVNRSGLIVGYALDSDSASHGVLWYRGNMYLMDDVIGAPLVHVHSLWFVNDNDRIAGITFQATLFADGGSIGTTRTFAFDVLQYPTD